MILEPLRLVTYLLADILFISWNVDTGINLYQISVQLGEPVLLIGISSVILMVCRALSGLSLALWTTIVLKTFKIYTP